MNGVSRRRVLGRMGLGGGAGVAAAALAACGSSQEAPAASTAKAVQLTYLHTWTPQQGHGPATDALAARFNQETPSIQVRAVSGGGGQPYYEKFTALLAGGDLPDVASSKIEYLPFLVGKQAVVSPEMLAKGQYKVDKNDLVPASKEMTTFDGKLMAMPYILSNTGNVYNQTLFKQHGLDPTKPPATWNDLVDMGKRLSTGSGETETWGLQFPRKDAALNPWLILLWQNGGDAVDLTRKVATWNSPAGVEALQFWVDLVVKHRVGALEQPANAFQIGRAGLWELPVGSVSIVDKAVGTQFQWGAAALPRGKQAASNVGGHTLSVMKASKSPDQARRFVHWFTQPQVIVEFSVPSFTLPPWRSAQKQATWQRFLKEQPRVQPFVDMLEVGHAPPKLVTADDVFKTLTDAIELAVTQKALPKAALDDAARQAEPLIKQG